jgi:hypothetical protein
MGRHLSFGRRARAAAVIPALLALLALTVASSSARTGASSPRVIKDAGRYLGPDAVGHRTHGHGTVNQQIASAPTPVLANHFEVLGHNDLGARDTNGDVWVHGNFAYVGTWSNPCNGRGVKIIDVSNLRDPRLIGTLAKRKGTSAEDMVVRHVSTPFFTGDLLAVGIQRCGEGPAFDRQQYGVDFWDVSNPYRPRKLSFLGVTNGQGGVHELDVFQRGGNVYALLATPWSEWFDPVPGGDFRIVDATNPQSPVQVGEWGAGAHGFAPGPFWGQGSFGSTFDHSARASADGLKAYVSYWDLGVLTLDISDVTNPVLLTRTGYAPDDDGDAHSVSTYRGFLLQNDEDFDPRSPVHLLYRGTTAVGNESPFAPAIWLEPGHAVSGAVAEAANQGCDAADYPAGTAGKIAVVRSPFELLSEPSEERLCDQGTQELAAEAAGAAAVVHDFISTDTSPQWWDPAEVGIPVVFTDHATARAVVAAGAATLQAPLPSWGFMRVFDAATGTQVARFDGVPNVHALPPPPGDWSIHNNEVLGDHSYASWYSNGVLALDLTPLNRARPGNPRLVGQFIPEGAPSHTDFIASGVPNVWGVAIRASDKTIFASDLNGGLWIVRPTGRAAP